MDTEQAKQWLLEVDSLCGAGFHVDNPANQYDPPMSAKFEADRRAFCRLAKREGFDPYEFAMQHMPSFQRNWRSVHGPDFAVPLQLEGALKTIGFIDDSWHNNACPVFRNERHFANKHHYFSVWCDHPSPEERETKQARFIFNESGDDSYTDGTDLFATESPDEMISFLSGYFARLR